MEEKKVAEEQACQNPMEETTAYHFKGRSYIVQPVFKADGGNSLGAVLLHLMRADQENDR